MFSQTQHADACLGAAVKASIDTLKVCLATSRVCDLLCKLLLHCLLWLYQLCVPCVCGGGASWHGLAGQEAGTHACGSQSSSDC